MPADSSLEQLSPHFGDNRRNPFASHSTCANIKKAHSLLSRILTFTFDASSSKMAETLPDRCQSHGGSKDWERRRCLYRFVPGASLFWLPTMQWAHF